jgi:histidinol-phosphate aminotransferase
MTYFRPNVAATAGYIPGEQPQQGAVIKLNTNENPYPPSPAIHDAIARVARDRLRLYPDPIANAFREAAGRVLGVPPDWIVPTNGSDEALTLLTRACLGADDLMVAPTPSYLLYKVLAQIEGCRYLERPFDADGGLPNDFCCDAKLAFIPNPNSPTGGFITPRRLLDLAENASGLLVVDEAYVDFAPDSCIAGVRECERLVVSRTLSKSHGLAGLRFGFVVAQPIVAATLRKIKDSYNCDALSIAAATAAFEDVAYLAQTRAKILATRARMEHELAKLGFNVHPSHANFVWARREKPVKPMYEALKRRNILIRYIQYEGYGDGLRISVGTDAEIDRLFEELRQIV